MPRLAPARLLIACSLVALGTAPRALLLAAVAFGAGGCTRPSTAPDSALPPEGLPDQESWGAVLRLSEGGQPRAVLAAPYLARYDRPDSQVVRLGPDPAAPSDTAVVQATLYGEDGAPRARIRARRLTYDERARRFTAEGAVAVRAPGGRSLDAERVTWDEADRRLRVPGAFRYRSGAERIAGVGLVASDDLATYTFARARGTLEVTE